VRRVFEAYARHNADLICLIKFHHCKISFQIQQYLCNDKGKAAVFMISQRASMPRALLSVHRGAQATGAGPVAPVSCVISDTSNLPPTAPYVPVRVQGRDRSAGQARRARGARRAGAALVIEDDVTIHDMCTRPSSVSSASMSVILGGGARRTITLRPPKTCILARLQARGHRGRTAVGHNGALCLTVVHTDAAEMAATWGLCRLAPPVKSHLALPRRDTLDAARDLYDNWPPGRRHQVREHAGCRGSHDQGVRCLHGNVRSGEVARWRGVHALHARTSSSSRARLPSCVRSPFFW
jgi:hypothetical protein